MPNLRSSSSIPAVDGWDQLPPPSSPIAVIVSGSLVFGIDLKPDDVGTGTVLPKSVWETHPITEIVFEPEWAEGAAKLSRPFCSNRRTRRIPGMGSFHADA